MIKVDYIALNDSYDVTDNEGRTINISKETMMVLGMTKYFEEKKRADELSYKLQLAEEKAEKAKKEEQRALHDESYYFAEVKKQKQRADVAESNLEKLKIFVQTELDDYGLDACGDWTSALQMVIDKIEQLERGEG